MSASMPLAISLTLSSGSTSVNVRRFAHISAAPAAAAAAPSHDSTATLDPRGREQLAREHLPEHQPDVEDDGEM